MSSRRRLKLRAAAVPRKRLPVGTPHVATFHSPSISPARSLEAEIVNDAQSETQDVGEMSDVPPSTYATLKAGQKSLLTDTNANAITGTISMSLAEAKLARQNKRIQEAEAALVAPLPLDRERQGSRGKCRAPKNHESPTVATQRGTANDGGVPLSTVRINTFRPATRDSSIIRSMSSLSQHTTGTGMSDADRQDSIVNKKDEFHVSRGRNRGGEDFSIYSDKPEERQTSVEATFDECEIYQVFGNALPAPNFVEQNVGGKNGELRFVQHPNGDVSAHQWSEMRYIWENIGQFSNIRKKIEGQLASDRLKGETAHQTLQQNTLVYFRLVAKQREAGVMGLPFGVEDIQAALPNPSPELANRNLPTKVDVGSALQQSHQAISVQDQHENQEPVMSDMTDQYSAAVFAYDGYGGYAGHSEYHGPQYGPQDAPTQYVPTGPRASRYQRKANVASDPLYDPFYSSNTWRTVYGTPSRAQPGFRASSGGYMAGPVDRSYPTPDYRFPLPLRIDRVAQDLGPIANEQAWPRLQSRKTSTTDKGQSQSSSAPFLTSSAAMPTERMSSRAQGQRDPGMMQDMHLSGAGQNDTVDRNYESNKPISRRHGTGSSVAVPLLNPSTPLSVRNAMRDHLIKLGNQAKERSLSQVNLRSGLHDPFQPSATATPAHNVKMKSDDDSPRVYKTVANPSGILPTPKQTVQHTTPVRPVTPTLDKGRTAHMSIVGDMKDISLEYSDVGKPLMASTLQDKPTPQNLTGPFFNDTPFSARSSHPLSRPYAAQKGIHEDIGHWWKSGNTFQRQEEFYRSIRAANEGPSGNHSSPAALAVVSTPVKKDSTPLPTDDPMTRLLIPVLENLSSYVQGPVEKRRDYFSRWSQPPEWCIDRSPDGNNSFFDGEWGQPPARVGRDPRYRPLPVESVRFGGFSTPQAVGNLAVGSGVAGLDRRFMFGGRSRL